MYLYNTLTRKKEEFIPIDSHQVKIYSCGPTVYSEPHIGNFKSLCFSDLLRGVIKHIAWYPVFHVMNITDVGHLVSDGDEWEDKMQKWAKKEGITAKEVAKKYENKFKLAMKVLRVEEFDVMPRATEHIAEQISLVHSLEQKWYTYVLDDGIYFDTSKVNDYGKLMWPNYKKHIAWLRSGARIWDNGKKNPTDFALRKFSPGGEQRDMERDSPRGKGFPGWHLECSAMSSKYLGNHFDIHVWGPEHISVHHSNEIVQSECGLDLHGAKNWVNYWVHHGVLTVDGWKMSKSLGNGYTLQQLAEKEIDPLDLRMFFFTAHYRSYQDFTRDTLKAVKTARYRMRKKIAELLGEKRSKILSTQDIKTAQAKDFNQKIRNLLLDDLKTVEALALINTVLSQWANTEILKILYDLDQNIFKLDLFVPIEEEEKEISPEIILLAEQRKKAKDKKDYVLADQLRNQIQESWFTIKDTADGYEIS